MKVLVVQGPNLDRLGTREPAIYGTDTLDAIHGRLRALAAELGIALDTVQSNHEGVLIDRIGASDADGFVVNAAGYTHTSVALRDALIASGRPFVEVHLSNVAAREPFRHTSLLSDVACGVVSGFGPIGYELALRGLRAALLR
ncbi:MAG: type II 3-dehydroquinate dehydratase [Myxococcota bacterium]